jgi:hypothetical protein
MISSHQKFAVGLSLNLRVLEVMGEEEGEGREDGEAIGAGKLGFLFRLFERAIEDLAVALRDRGTGIGSVVLEGEVEGMMMTCEFVMSRED